MTGLGLASLNLHDGRLRKTIRETAMNLARALGRSFLDLFSPRILLLVLVPPLGSLALWVVLAFLFWDQILGFSQVFGERFLFTQQIPGWLVDWFSVTPTGVATALAVVVAVLLIMPLAVITSLLITSVAAMPVVLGRVGQSFPNLQKRGSGAFRASMWNLVKASSIYLILWVVTIPLWVVPGLGFAIPILLNGYLNYRVFIYDALGDYATESEIQALVKGRRLDFLLLGVITSAIVVFPLFYLILPVYAALCFARLGLSELEVLRQS